MLDLLAFSSALFAFALLHAAVPDRLPFALRAERHRRWGASLRLMALLLSGASLWLWVTVHGGSTGSILFALSSLLSGCLFVLAVSVAPRLVWALALFVVASSTLGAAVVRGLYGP